MLLAAFVSDATAALSRIYPKEEARTVVLLLCGSLLGTKSYTHIIEPRTEVPPSMEAPLGSALGRLLAGEPVQYVIGKADFHGLSFKVTSAVLIPRPETEMLVDMAVEAARERMRRDGRVRVLDLCTGSGCIAWTVALSVPRAEVVGVDVSEAALQVAAAQDFVSELKAAGAKFPEFVRADVLDEEAFPDLGFFDVVVSNPPYVMEKEKRSMRANVLDYEPGLALFVPDDDPLVFYRKIARISRKRLSSGGMGFAEINEILGTETEQVLLDAGFREVSVVKDFFEKDRFVSYR